MKKKFNLTKAMQNDPEALGILNDLITEAEGKTTARTVCASDIISVCRKIENNVPTKTALEGTKAYYDGGEKFPNAYKYTPQSTHFCVEFKNRKWWLTDIGRDICPNRTYSGRVIYSDAAIDAIIEKMSKL